MNGVLLDVGGVFLVPSRVPLIGALGASFSGLSDIEFDRAHFEGIRSLDTSQATGHEERRAYLEGYLSSLGVPHHEVEGRVETLVPLWSGPSLQLWRRVLGESVAGLRSLHDADLKLGIVSNSDGHVEAELLRSHVCQVGPGRGVPVLTVIDSGVVGVSKPDPSIFDFALPALAMDPSQVTYVGDSVKYDIRSAEAAGMTPLHFDPFDLCPERDHAHIRRLDEVLRDV